MNGDPSDGRQELPPALIHLLRSISMGRLHKMCSDPGKKGFGRYVRNHIVEYALRGKTPTEIAINVAYDGCFLTDHLVQAERRAALLIDGHTLTPDEERTIWEKNYKLVISRILKGLPDGETVARMLDRLPNLTNLPDRAHHFRARHWQALETWITRRGSSAPGELTHHIHQVVASGRRPHAKARAIILAGSLLADIISRDTGTPWPHAYAIAITRLYREFAGHGDILGELI